MFFKTFEAKIGILFSSFSLISFLIAALFLNSSLNLPISILLVLSAISICISSFYVSYKICNPLRQLSKYATQLSALSQFHSQNLSKSEEIKPIANIFDISEKHSGEVRNLSDALLDLKFILNHQIKQLRTSSSEKESYEKELKIAHQIQMGFLPQDFPVSVKRKELDLYASMIPAKEVGGDLYDFFFIGDDLYFAIGDVSDKGVPSALFMVICKTLIKVFANQGLSPGMILQHINETLLQNNPREMFITLIVGTLNLENGSITYANAGHNPPILHAQDQIYFKRDVSGPMVGVFDDITYPEYAVTLSTDDFILLYSDGVTEALDVNRKQFSEYQLFNLACQNKANSPASMVNQIILDVNTHALDTHQSDDITLMMIKFVGGEVDQMVNKIFNSKSFRIGGLQKVGIN